jgi:hypothetical protein
MQQGRGRGRRRMMQGSSYYAVLGVHPGASAAEIRAAYHRLAMVSAILQHTRSGFPVVWFRRSWKQSI